MHLFIAIHHFAWMEHPAIWLCASCAILWLVLRVVRSPLVRTGVLLMLCGLGMNALVTDSNAGSMPVVGMPATVRPASPMWQGATLQTRMPLLADQAVTSLCSSGVFLLWPSAFDGRWNGDARICRRLHDAPQPSTIYDLALTGNPLPSVRRQKKEEGVPTFPDCQPGQCNAVTSLNENGGGSKQSASL